MPKESATIPQYLSTGLHYNHRDMTRLGDAQDPAFKAIQGELSRWSKPICQAAKLRAANDPGPETDLPLIIGMSRRKRLDFVASNVDMTC